MEKEKNYVRLLFENDNERRIIIKNARTIQHPFKHRNRVSTSKTRPRCPLPQATYKIGYFANIPTRYVLVEGKCLLKQGLL